MTTSVNPLELTLISDTHYYSKKTGVAGPAYERDNQKSQKLLRDAEEVIRAAFRQIAKDGRSDIVLLSGDVTNNGELTSHEEIRALLRELQLAGKRVFVLTATHDYDKAHGYDGDQRIPVPSAEREDLWEMYRAFGPDQAFAVHRESMSYAAKLADGYRLLALNDDRDGEGHCGFNEELMDWIRAQVADAQAAGDFVLPMTHHPMLPPSPFYAIIGKGDMMNHYEQRAGEFADMGLPFCFTGHTHIQDISFLRSPSGRVFYDLSTPSLVGYPGTLRHITADAAANTLRVSTEYITEPADLPGGDGDLQSRFANQFFGMIRDVLAAAATDIDRFAEMATAFSIRPRFSYRFGWLIKPVAKWFNRLTVGKVGRWTRAETGLRPEEYTDIQNETVVSFIISLVMYLFAGNSPYGPDTAHYKITIGLLNIIDSFLRALGIRFGKIIKGADSVRSLVEPLLYNSGIDDAEATLPLTPTEEQLRALCAPTRKETVRPSRKGPWLLAALVCLLIVLLPFLPLLALAFGGMLLVNQARYGKKMTR
ncbi:MAG: metallophosphoesterase [Oscillospiraceae bacterium]|jgi:hypothetical protein|nr:metallophosphoesterase [Oscillospiraceae bacterium]